MSVKNIDEAYELVQKMHLEFDHHTWTHHGLGMLQCKIDHETRVRLWHPLLVSDEMCGARGIHDHRFNLTSHVLYGRIVDEQYDVVINPQEPSWWSSRSVASAWAIPHKEIQTETDKHAERAVFLGRAFYARDGITEHTSFSTYKIAARRWHTTVPVAPAITVVTRSSFDAEPARVLGNGRSGQIGNTSPALVMRVFADCAKLMGM